MPHWRQLIEKDYLGAWDLVGKDDKPKDFTLTIASVKSDLLKTRETPKGKRKCVIRFEGAQKAMVANATNCEIIEGMYGGDVAGWVGKKITLYQGDVRSPKGGTIKGGTIKGVKVRPKIPSGAAEALEPKPVDEQIRKAQDEAFDRGSGPDDY